MRLAVHFGALAEPIAKQLKKQRVHVPTAEMKRCQHLADSITMLAVHGYIGDRNAERLRKRVLRQLLKCAVVSA